MPPQPLRQFGPYRLKLTSGQLWRHGQVIHLPPRALAVLRQLVMKEALLDAGWPDTAVSEWVLTTCMRALRRVLGDDAWQPQYIATVHRRGYRFVAPVHVAEPLPPQASSPPWWAARQSSPVCTPTLPRCGTGCARPSLSRARQGVGRRRWWASGCSSLGPQRRWGWGAGSGGGLSRAP
jgi:DNA-binding winged helix-turn-helix (wHTH) protein